MSQPTAGYQEFPSFGWEAGGGQDGAGAQGGAQAAAAQPGQGGYAPVGGDAAGISSTMNLGNIPASLMLAASEKAPEYELLKFDSTNTDTLTSAASVGTGSVMEELSYKVETLLNRAWAEFFGFLRLLVVLAVTALGQSLRFVGWLFKRAALVPLVVVGDQVLRPLLWVVYGSFLYPVLVFLSAVVRALLVIVRDVVEQLWHAVAPAVSIIRAFRLVEINHTYAPGVQPQRTARTDTHEATSSDAGAASGKQPLTV